MKTLRNHWLCCANAKDVDILSILPSENCASLQATDECDMAIDQLITLVNIRHSSPWLLAAGKLPLTTTQADHHNEYEHNK